RRTLWQRRQGRPAYQDWAGNPADVVFGLGHRGSARTSGSDRGLVPHTPPATGGNDRSGRALRHGPSETLSLSYGDVERTAATISRCTRLFRRRRKHTIEVGRLAAAGCWLPRSACERG